MACGSTTSCVAELGVGSFYRTWSGGLERLEADVDHGGAARERAHRGRPRPRSTCASATYCQSYSQPRDATGRARDVRRVDGQHLEHPSDGAAGLQPPRPLPQERLRRRRRSASPPPTQYGAGTAPYPWIVTDGTAASTTSTFGTGGGRLLGPLRLPRAPPRRHLPEGGGRMRALRTLPPWPPWSPCCSRPRALVPGPPSAAAAPGHRLSPHTGPTAGGNYVLLHGSGFDRRDGRPLRWGHQPSHRASPPAPSWRHRPAARRRPGARLRRDPERHLGLRRGRRLHLRRRPPAPGPLGHGPDRALRSPSTASARWCSPARRPRSAPPAAAAGSAPCAARRGAPHLARRPPGPERVVHLPDLLHGRHRGGALWRFDGDHLDAHRVAVHHASIEALSCGSPTLCVDRRVDRHRRPARRRLGRPALDHPVQRRHRGELSRPPPPASRPT